MNRKTVEPTPFGPVVLFWAELEGRPKVFRVSLAGPGESPKASPYPEAKPGTCAAIDDLDRAIQAFLGGEDVTFPLALAAMRSRPAFQQAVLRAEHAIPRGSVSTYGLLAARLGKPKAVRAVGRALATNPFPIIVPCHRAVRSSGELGGYQGGPAMKRALLEREGVAFDAAGRVAVPRFHYT